MTAKHCPPSAAIISEHREGPVEAEVGTSNGAGHIHSHRSDRLSHTQLKRSSHEYNMPSSRGNTSRERSGRSQRAMTVTETNGHNAIKRKNNIIVRRTNSISSGEIAPREYTLSRPRRRQSNKDAEYSSSSSSSSSEGEEEEHREHIKDPKRPVAAPITGKEKLTSPSSLSTATAVTNGSTESSSTLKPESAATRPLALRKQAHVEEAPPTPISPAVPDAPDVFSFLAADSDGDDSPQDQPVDPMVESQWLPPKAEDSKSVGSRDSDKHSERAAGSSVTSSFHSDTFSDPIADNDTDRSSSPDMSVKGRRDSQYSRDSHRSHGTHERHEHHESKHPRDLPDLGTKSNCSSPTDAPKDGVSAKLASQIAAANKRQNRLKAAQPLGIPITPWMPRMHDMPQATPAFPPVPPMALAPQYYPSPQPGPRRAGSLPVTGYELLAARLSSHASTAESEGAPKIKPMYRKFEALNHRVLLHLQDELSELEEHLHQLDMADTQSRCIDRSQILPASRRASVQPGGELEYRKAEILGRIGYKLAQYNQALSSFHSTQALDAPEPKEVSKYREYLRSEHPIAEAETRFLDPADDLVSVCSDKLTSKRPSNGSTSSSLTAASRPSNRALSIYAAAIAGAVLIPILTFTVIPGFFGRLTVAVLVALGMIGALFQAGMFRREYVTLDMMTCTAAYSVVMVVIAAIMA